MAATTKRLNNVMKTSFNFYNENENNASTKPFRLGKKYFGELIGETFKRNVRLSRHLYRALDGWGIDIWLLKELEYRKCRLIQFFDKEEDKQYEISLIDFKRNSSTIDHGFGVQLICPRRFWKVTQLDHQLSLIGDLRE